METNKKTSAFTEWYDGLVGFQLTSERILDDLRLSGFDLDHEVDPLTLRKWMIICWNTAIETAQEELKTEEYFWVDLHENYGASFPEIQIEKLKEPLDTGSKI